MKDCKIFKPMIDKALYNELSSQENESLQNHLAQCDECSSELGELKETLSLIKLREREEPETEFMNNFWQQLEPKLQKKRAPIQVWFEEIIYNLRNRYSFQIAAAASLLIIGILIGKFFLTGIESGPPQISKFESKKTDPKVIEARAERYIDRSKILMLGLMNFDPESDDIETLGLRQQKKISDELISEAEILNADLAKSPNLQMQKLVSDIEIILMQIANLEQENDISGIELIKDGVDQRGIFLKINIQEMKNSVSKSENKSGSVPKAESKNI